jgi:hypothetical protein
MTIYQRLAELWTEPVVEAEKRNKDGVRWIIHRFPIKGGISRREAMLRDCCRPSTLL